MGSTELKLPGRVSRSSARRQVPSFSVILAGLFLLFLFTTPQYTQAQRKSDIGLIGGTSYYLGDLNFTRHFYLPSAAGGAIIRYNLNPRNSLRLSGIYGSIKGDNLMLSDDFHSIPGFKTSD